MKIEWIGHSCFKISLNGGTIILTDPFSPEIGLAFPKTTADIITISHNHFDHNFTKGILNSRGAEPFKISGPGEYEVAGVKILGISTFHDKSQGKERGKNTIYQISAEEINLLHLGDLGTVLDDETLKKLDEIDVLFVPIGGKFTIDASEASEVIGQIEPKIVIPMHYKVRGLKIEIDDLEPFKKEQGLSDIRPKPSLAISKNRLPEEPEIVVLKPQAKPIK